MANNGKKKDRRVLTSDADLELRRKEGDHQRGTRVEEAICNLKIGAIYIIPIILLVVFVIAVCMSLWNGDYVQAIGWSGVVATNGLSFVTGRNLPNKKDIA